MTAKELSQLYYLNKEIKTDEQRLEELREKSKSPQSARLDGIPGVIGNESRVERYAAEIIDIEAIIAAKREQCIHERNRLERYINDIDDSLIRQIFALRFVDGLSWGQVAARIGGNNTRDSIRMTVKRFLSKK